MRDVTGTAASLPRRPEPPTGLPKDAREAWRAIVSEYPAKHFRGANLIILETFCRARAFVIECDKAIARDGLLIDGKRNPVVGMRATGWAEMRACATKLRLSISGTLRAEAAAARPDPNAGLRKPWERSA
jgi:P27 family predicted phage terminase small subunit